MDGSVLLSSSQIERIVAGLAVCRRHVGIWEGQGVDKLPDDRLLLLRTLEGVIARVQDCLDDSFFDGPGILSPADLWALQDLAELAPADRQALVNLETALIRVGRMTDPPA